MQNDKIVYSFFKSPLGEMIGGASEQGVCLLEWVDRGGLDRIRERMQKRYQIPTAEGTNRHVEQLERELALYFDRKLKKFGVSIDVKGTPFERQVWDVLLSISHGTTKSYGDVAKLIGKPRASRAVGRANGANYLGIVIPCHRVIEADGSLRGYGGGLWRKRYLLALEAGVEQLPVPEPGQQQQGVH